MSESAGFATYHKIHSVFKRDQRGRFMLGEYSRPEIEYLANSEWLWTEKVDGTNIRIGIDADNVFRIGGRTDRAQIPVRLLDAIAELDLERKIRDHFGGNGGDPQEQPEEAGPITVTLYGEGYGAKIQKGGGNYRQDQGFVLFDVNVSGWWLRRGSVEDVAQALGLDVVPVVHEGTIASAIDIVGTPEGQKSSWGMFRAEGLVGTPAVPLFARDGSRVVVKVKSKDFDRLRREGLWA